MFLGIYTLLTSITLLVTFLRGWTFALIAIQKSIYYHNKMFTCVINACMDFFDSTPIGRILNAFSRHLNAIDAQLSDSLFQLMLLLLVSVGSIAAVIGNIPETTIIFVTAAVIIAIIFLFLGRVEQRLKNQEALTRSSIFSHLTASLEGLFSIRAYECQERFLHSYNEKIDENHIYQFSMMESKIKFV